MTCPYRKLDPDVVMVQPTKHRLSFDTPVTLNGCPYRKLDPDVLMVQPTKHRLSFDTPVTLNGPSIGRIFP
jgi:hypothetical protein